MHCNGENIDWRALFLAFIALAGWQHTQNTGKYNDDWVPVAEDARTHRAWFWVMASGK